MKFKIAKQTVEARRVHSLGTPHKSDDPLHPNIGKIPVQFDYEAAPLPEKPVLTGKESALQAEDILKPYLDVVKANDLAARAACELIDAGTLVKAGDYQVAGRFVDGEFFESITGTSEAEA